VRGCVVIMEQPIAREPQFRSFSPNVIQMIRITILTLTNPDDIWKERCVTE
jgi:hypothetical protein